MSMATYSSHTLPVRGRGSSGMGSAGLMEKIHEMLTERECSIFDEGLAAYHKRKDVNRFVESLSLVLNTNSKRQLLVTIRNTFIKPSDLIKFNDLCIKYGLALPLKGNTTKNAKKMFNKTQTGPKVYELKRDDKGEWGFSIRGGIDHGIGIFVSWVDRGSNAEKAGLKIGDYIHRVNEVGLEGLTFAQATQIFRNRSKIRMVITSYGRIPGFQFANKSYRWVDRDGKPVSPPTEVESLGMTTSGHVDPNVRTVNLSVDSGKVLGISIRGGAEHGLGIYISGVDAGSVADTNGIKRGEQILEVNGVSYINILHPDAAKGLKEERAMVMRLKDIGKLPHSKIPPPPPVQAWQMQQQQQMTNEPSVTRSVKSLPGTMKRSTEYTDSKKPGEGGTPVMITKRIISPGRGIMNEVAESLLTKAEMTTFTYYITGYEHNQINVESLVQYLLKLLNTDKKMGLIAEVRNIIREQDLDAYNELTATRELQSFRANKSFNDSDDEDMAAAVHAINGIQNKDERDDDSLDDVPQRIVPVTFHPPPPPPGGPDTSTPQLLAMTMKDRRRNLHESVLEDESWDDSTLPRPIPMFNEDAMQKKLQGMKQEVEEKLKKEYEEELEAKLQAEKEELERQKAEMRKIQEEKEEIEKQLQNMSSGEDKEKLEEEIWRQAEESLRQELTDQIQKESKEKMKEEYDKLLETSLAEERKKTEAERKMREELELKQREKNILEREREEQKRIEMEEKARRSAEEKARREYEQRLQRESEEKARLAEEVKSYRSMKIELENEKDQRERLERAKKTAERKAEEEEAEKERIRNKLKKEKLEAEEKAEKEESEKKKIEKKLKREKEEAEEKAEREEAEKRKLKALLEKKEKELQEKEREQAEAALLLQKQKEQEKRKSELQREAEEEERLRQEQQKSKQEEEKRKRRQERELARQAEEERKRRLREEEERKLQEQQQEAEEGEEEDDEEEERRQREEEEEAKRQRQEAEKRQKEEEKRRKEEEKRKKEEERQRKEEERQRKEEERRRKEEEKRQREEEKRQREEEEKRQREEQRRQREEEEREREQEERLRMEEKRLSKEGSFFDPVLMDELVISSSPSQALPTQNPSKPHVTFEDQKKKEQKIIENERKLAEQMLAVRLREKQNEPKEEGRISFAGYTNLKGELKKVTIKKVNKKLGIAVDGGANTKQKAVIVRQIVPDGSAALSGKDLEIGQQILAVNGKSLKGLKHKDAVLAIKNAFDGPMQKVIEFDMLVAED